MRTTQEIQDKIFELQNSNKKYITRQVEMLKWVLEESNTTSVTTSEIQKDGINIEFG